MTNITRSARVLEVVVKAGQTESEPLTSHVGQSAWGAIEFPDGNDAKFPIFRPGTCETLITTTDEYTSCIDEQGGSIGAVAVNNGKYIIPLTAFYFVGLKFKFDVAPAADTKILVTMRG